MELPQVIRVHYKWILSVTNTVTTPSKTWNTDDVEPVIITRPQQKVSMKTIAIAWQQHRLFQLSLQALVTKARVCTMAEPWQASLCHHGDVYTTWLR